MSNYHFPNSSNVIDTPSKMVPHSLNKPGQQLSTSQVTTPLSGANATLLSFAGTAKRNGSSKAMEQVRTTSSSSKLKAERNYPRATVVDDLKSGKRRITRRCLELVKRRVRRRDVRRTEWMGRGSDIDPRLHRNLWTG